MRMTSPTRFSKNDWYHALQSTQSGGYIGLSGETFLAIRELGNDRGTPITPDVIDGIIDRLDLQVRHLVVDLLDALDQCGWLIKMDHDRYEFNVPDYARRFLEPPPPPKFAIEFAVARRSLPAVPARVATPTAPIVRRERVCALYRWRDRDRNLLYVGVTYDLDQREASHAGNSRWWIFAARCQVEWFPSRTEALAAEQAAIRTESPIFNTAYNTRADAAQRIIEYLTARKRTDLLPPKLAA